MSEPTPRWRAEIFYRSEAGEKSVRWYFEELLELHNIVERGPNFYTIDRIEVSLTGRAESMTLEEAMWEGLN